MGDQTGKTEGTLLGMDRDEAAYILPMAAFLILIGVGGWITDHPWGYLPRAILVPILLAVFWKRYTKIRWDYWWLGAIFGVLGIVQWIGMEKLLGGGTLSLFGSTFTFKGVTLFGSHYPFFMKAPEAVDPTAQFSSPAMMWTWVAIRWGTASITVPIMEELFWRDWLWRQMLAPADFKLARVGEWDLKVFLTVALVFAIPHPQWWLTAITWALMIGGLLAWTKSLGACIVMHGVTNFLLGAYVLHTKDWAFW